ncbi:hypothetical protein LCGC14_1881160 [marine sediment metagenome]|uniref:Uncharacterized protein n=1 Tax=marine sediment metagenome TaxID=412755 RepID=A0A0F9J0P8_9ZZZZ
MKLENQVVSLKLAKQLKEVGYEQEGLFWWVKYKLVRGTYVKGFDEPKKGWRLQYGNKEGYRDEFLELCVASTVAELGEIFPRGYESYKRTSGDSDWICNDNTHKIFFYANTEVNARAKMMWWYLKEK